MGNAWGAIAQAVGGIVGGIGSNLIQNKGNARAQHRQNRINLANWHLQNEYNHPSAQMARLKEAGLNPNLIYGTSGSSSVGNASPPPDVKAAPYKFDNPLQSLSAFVDFKQKNATTDNLVAQNTVLDQEAILKAMQAADLGVKTARGKFDLGLAEELKNTSLQAAKENVRFMEQNTLNKQLDNDFKSQALKEQVKRIFYETQSARETLQGHKLQNKIHQLDIQLKQLGIEKGDPWYFRIFGRHIKEFKKGLQDTEKSFIN